MCGLPGAKFREFRYRASPAAEGEWRLRANSVFKRLCVYLHNQIVGQPFKTVAQGIFR